MKKEFRKMEHDEESEESKIFDTAVYDKSYIKKNKVIEAWSEDS